MGDGVPEEPSRRVSCGLEHTLQLREQLVESEASMFQVLESADAELVEYEEVQRQMQSLQDAAEREAGRMDAEMSATAREIALVREGKWNGEDADDGEDSNKGTLSEEEEEQLRKRLVELDSMLVTVDEDIRNLHTQSTQLQEIFKRMMRQSRAPTLDTLVEIFRREETFRFEQYSYIQRMNVEIKGLDERLQQVVVDLEKEKEDRRKRAEERFQSTIKIRTELGVLRSSTRSAETELRESAARGRDLLRLALKCYESVGGQAPRILRLWDAIGGGVRRTSVAGLPTGLDSARHVRPSNVWSSAPNSPLPTFAPTRRPPALSNAGSLSGAFELAEAHLATDESVDSAPTVTLESALDLLASLEGKFSELLGIFVNLLQHPKFKPRVINALRRRILAHDALHASPTSSSAPLSIHAGKPVPRADPSPIRLSSWTKRPPLRADELVGEIERAVALFFQGPRVEAPPRARGKGTVGPNVMEKLPSLPRSSAALTPKGTPPVGARSGRTTTVGASVTLSDVYDEEDEEEELMGSRPLRREEIIHLARRSQAGGTPTATEGGGGGLSSRQRSRTGSASRGRRSIALAGAASLVPDESARRRMGR